LIENNSTEEFTYFNYFGKIESNLSKAQLIDELTEVTLGIFKETLERVDKRQIVIPLSAGNDSRLVASCFKHLGTENILCFTYGNKNSFEVKTAKKIAKKLGFDWVFVPLTHRGERKFYKSQTFKDYLDFADSVDSIPYFQGLTSIKYLKENMLLEEDAVFINGNSGDFISGLHINKLYETIKNNFFYKKDLIDVLREKYIEKHFSLWGYLKREENISLLNYSIDKALDQIGEINNDNVHLAYEMLELIDRQSKYVIAGQKTFEFFNYEWLLPLWEDKYLNFWKKVPVNFKHNQTLYKEMLIQNNFGGVWDESIPVNKKKINSLLVQIIRLFFKTFFIFSSKNKWHQFETVFIKYWTDSILYYKFMPFWRIIFDYNKKPRNAISWVAKIFLNKNL
jgi:asparagine synthase (glutamine-hydrolysing)